MEIAAHDIPFRQALRVWTRIALLSFGGPAGQIAVMHRILVDEKKWIGERHFLHALNYCMLLPGPEAQQLATYIGWLLHGTKGGLAAGLLFILPGFAAIMGLSWLYAAYGGAGPVEALFFGLKAAVIAIVLDAVRRIGGRALGHPGLYALAAAAFVAIFFFAVPFPLIILAASAMGYIGGLAGLSAFGRYDTSEVRDAEPGTLLGTHVPAHVRLRVWTWLRLPFVLLFLWLAPVAALRIFLGPQDVYSQIALFFSKMATVTFGGAYAALAYVAQQAVQDYGWLRPGEMLDGLGMAETTPGPLIMVTQFVGFMGAFRNAGALHPMLAGTLGAILTTWVTFLPCFLWIFLGAPFVERLRGNRALSAALTAVTAAVVGVILNLALWFALHSLFGQAREVKVGPLQFGAPVLASIDIPAMLLALAAIVAIFRFRVGAPWVLFGTAAAGLTFRMIAA